LSRDETEPFSPLTTPDEDQKRSTITKTKRARNRASLPAYFSLLQTSNDTQTSRVPLSADSSSHSATRPSPPTPRLIISGMPIHPFTAPPTATTTQATPRGRRRVLEASQSSRIFANESSSSRSRSRNSHPFAPPATASEAFRSQLSSKGSKSSMERILDWAAVSGPPRGRTAVRRNSSPPPKMNPTIISCSISEQFNPASRGRKADSTSRPRPRGRAMVSELDGVGGTQDAPGFGYGRSGLLHRERVISQRYTDNNS
jgi:hypothetical protein